VPRNRRPQDREEKREEIVAAAATLFTEVGYDDASMVKVAGTAGVTTNTIYWYFADKDALLVAVLDHVLAQALAEVADQAHRPWVDQVLWAIEQLEQYSRLVTVVHARAATSESIDAWHANFHELVDSIMIDGFRQAGVADGDLRSMTHLSVFVVEGLLMHPHAGQDRRDIVELLVRPRSA
jgi:AcrR family transcriptional regulator